MPNVMNLMSRFRREPLRRAVDGPSAFGAIARDGLECWQSAGLTGETLVATQFGWRPAETIVAGDQVLTFDDGVQTVVSVTRNEQAMGCYACPRDKWPLIAPAGALGNAEPMVLLPEQLVLLESDVAEVLFGDPFVLVPAAALEGHFGIERKVLSRPSNIVTLHFADETVVFCAEGALAHCPAADVFEATSAGARPYAGVTTLSQTEAAFLMDCIADDLADDIEGAVFEEAFEQAANQYSLSA